MSFFRKIQAERQHAEEHEQLLHIFEENAQKGRYEIAQYLIKKYAFRTFSDTKETYIYEKGIFIPGGENLIVSQVQTILGKNASRNTTLEVIEHVKRSTLTPRTSFDENKNLLCLNNHVLDLETLETTPHSPDYNLLVKIPVIYNPEATCPKINQFLKEVLGPKDIPAFEEQAGYCLYRDYPIHKAFMHVGPGANGKSTALNVLKTLLGKDNYVSVSLHKLLTNRFAPASLYGKLANIYADLPNKDISNTDIFKILTGRDSITTERKFRDEFTFTNYSKQIFSANQVPKTYEDTDAYFRRWRIINYPNKFEGDQEDTKLLEKITTPEELSGFLNLAIAGLKRLLKNGEFTNSQTTEQVREEYIRKSDSVGAFIMDQIEISPEDFIPKKELYTEYCDYCRERSYPAKADTTFHKELQKQIRVEDYRPGGKDRARSWKGIRLKASNKVRPVPHVHDISYFKVIAENDNKMEKNMDNKDNTDSIPRFQRVETIFHKCYRCDLTPCDWFDNEAKQYICKLCKEDLEEK